jgi:cytoskeletal protein CcmA (bactofilin family)
MAKGLAVISGSNTVVFKALETGVVKMGGVHPDGSSLFAQVSISGSLVLSGSEGIKLNVSGSEFKIENLSGLGDQVIISGLSDAESDFGDQESEYGDLGAVIKRDAAYQLKGGLKWAATSSAPSGALEDKTTDEAAYYAALEAESGSLAPEDFLVITEDGELRRVNKIDASVVMLNDGQTVEQQVGGLNLNLKRTSAHDEELDEKDVNLTKGNLNFKDVAARTVISMQDADDGESVDLTIDLDPNLEVQTLSASMGLEVTGSSNLKGKLHVVDDGAEIDGNLKVNSDATIEGKLTVKGDLDVIGSISQVSVEQKNLTVTDAIITVGSGSDGTLGELGFVFGTEGASNKAFTLKDGDFYLGNTTDDGLDDNVLDPNNDGLGKLVLADLSASSDIDALVLKVHDSATITGDLVANSNVTLGDAADDIVLVNGTLTASAPARFQGSINVDSGADVVLGADSDLTLDQGTVTITQGNLDIGTGNITVTAGDISIVTGDLSLGDGDVVVDGSGSFSGDLNVDGTGSFGQSVTLRTGADLTLDKGSVTLTDGDLSVNGVTTLSASLGGNQPALDVTGTTVLSSSAGSNALHVESGDVQLDEALTVEGIVSLNSNAGSLNIAGAWVEEAALQITGSVDVGGDVRLGTDSSNRVVVQGQFRIPKFAAADIPGDYVTNARAYTGYMFYLEGAGNEYFPNGNKWYFNEGGEWHSSFFWDDGAEAEEGPEA